MSPIEALRLSRFGAVRADGFEVLLIVLLVLMNIVDCQPFPLLTERATCSPLQPVRRSRRRRLDERRDRISGLLPAMVSSLGGVPIEVGKSTRSAALTVLIHVPQAGIRPVTNSEPGSGPRRGFS